MSRGLFKPFPQKKQEGGLEQTKHQLQLLRRSTQIGGSLVSKNPERAVSQLIVAGLKMAGEDVFYNPLVNPLRLVDGLKSIGIGVLGWSPETLMASIDRKFGHWTESQVAEALDYFHKTGNLKTDVPQLVREKIYAIRVVATSNSAQTEWHIFEKIGGVFNDRIAQFGTVEPLTAAECARTVAIIEEVRPDSYENEIKIYIGAACHMSGLYTVAPVKWLAMAEPYLQQMNYEATADRIEVGLKDEIAVKLAQYRNAKMTLREVPDDVVSVQASKLLAIEEYAEEVLKEV